LKPDTHKIRIVDLPEGFAYQVLSHAGNRMSDGFYKPMHPAGMGVFSGPENQVILVRNHNVSPGGPSRKGPFGFKRHLLGELDSSLVYDMGGDKGKASLGGTTTLVYDLESEEVVRQHLSLAGTFRNAAGTETPWRSWISCERTKQSADAKHGKDHGYCFEVPASSASAPVEPAPLRAMGRFPRGGLAVAPDSGFLYQTEAEQRGLLYRFVPNERGKLRGGGVLQALAAVGRSQMDARQFGVGHTPIPVRWVDLDVEGKPLDSLRRQGEKLRCSTFANGGAMCTDGGNVYFICGESQGTIGNQIWQYSSGRNTANAEVDGELELVMSFHNDSALTSVADLSVTPWGDLLLCGQRQDGAFLAGATMEGRVYLIAQSRFSGGYPFEGATFAPDGRTLFVNIPKGGFTIAIKGPWYREDIPAG